MSGKQFICGHKDNNLGVDNSMRLFSAILLQGLTLHVEESRI